MMQKLKDFFRERDRFARHCGIELVEITPGGAKTKMKIADCHRNGINTVHGGALFTLADFTFAAASNSHGAISVAIHASIAFTKAATEGYLFAEAKELSLSPRLSTYLITITDDSGDVVASFQGTTYRKKESLLEGTA